MHKLVRFVPTRLRRFTRRDSISQQRAVESGHPIAELFDHLVAEAARHGADEDLISTALASATQAAAEVVAEQLRAGAPRMLREHARMRRGFEQRLRMRWGAALDLYECVRVACLEAGENFHVRQSQQASAEDFKRSALTLLHARACLVASEVQGLFVTGHAAGAQGRWRTLHELAVTAFILGSHDQEISKRFILHRNVERYQDAVQYQEYCEALGYERFSDDEMAELRQLYDEVIARYGALYKKPWGWAGPLLPSGQLANFAKLQQLAGFEPVKPWFRLSSHGIHSGATGAIHIMDFYAGRRDVMLAGPSNAGLADPGNGTLISLHQVTSALLIYARPEGPRPEDLVLLKAIAVLLDQAQMAFLNVHQALEAEEAAVREARG